MPGKAYKIVRGEIEAYGHGLAEKPEIVALSKADALDPKTLKEQVARLKRAAEARRPLVLSAASGQGVQEALQALLARHRRGARGGEAAPTSRGGLAAVTPGRDPGRRP